MGKAIMLFAMVLLTGFLSSCGEKNDKTKRVVEQLKPLPEAILPFLDSYTSGLIAEGEPIKVCFSDVEALKIKQGEPLPAKAFTFKPALKGEAYWIDERTVGFKYESLDDEPYVCTFKMTDFIDLPADLPLEFCFVKRRQNMSLVSIAPMCLEADKMGYKIRVAFSNPVSADDVMSIFESGFVRKYNPVATPAKGNAYDIEISDIERGEKEKIIELKLSAEDLQCDAKFNRVLVIYARDAFKPVQFDVERSQAQATLYFSQPLRETQNLDGFLKFSPEIAYRADIKGNKVDIFFDKSSISSWQLREMHLHVEAGIRSAAGTGSRYGADYDFDLTDDLPKVRWTCEGNIIPSVGDATVYFDAVCLNSVTLRIVRIFDDNILSFLQDNELNDTYGVRKAGRLEKKVRLEVENPNPTQWKTFPIVLSDYVTVEPGAMYQLIIDFGPQDYAFASDEMKALVVNDQTMEENYWNGEGYDFKEYRYDGDWNDPNGFYYYNYVEQMKNIVVSDLAVTAKMGRDDIMDVFVYRFSDAKPVGGVTVKAFNFQRQELAEVTTDANGYAQIKCANRPVFVMAIDGKDGKSVVKTTNGNALSYSRFDVSGEAVEKGIAAFAYSNRGVWRPGDELQLNLMLSDFDNQVPDNYPVVVEIYDASSRLYAKQVKSNAVGGIYCFNIPTNPSDETGLWKAKFKVGNSVITKMLRVETIKPNRLEINMNMPEVVSIKHPDRVTLSSKWLNGMKASGLKAEVDAKVRKGETAFKNFSNYTFVDETLEFYPEEIAVFSGPLNSEGSANIGFAPFGEIYSTQMLQATFTTKVFEQGGDFSITSSTATLSPLSRYVGVELPETTSKYGEFYDTDKDWKFNVAVVKESGVLDNSTVALDIALYKLDSYWWWSSEDTYSLQRYASGTYKRPVKRGTISCSGKTYFTLNLADEEWGSYLLVVEDRVSGSRFAKVIAFDWGTAMHAGSGSNAPVQLALRATKESYNVGDDIVVTFPANDKAKALVTVEANDKVLQSIYLDDLGTEGSVKIKATEEMIPNVYVYVALLQSHDAENDMPIRMYGVVPVKVEDKDLELKPTIDVPAESNTSKTISVKVGESKGKAMSYTLAIVDEGVLGLTNFSTPSPYRYFNGKQSLAVRTWDNYASVIDAFSGELGSVYAIGGDGIINQEITLDKRFKAYAVTLGPFELKAGATNTHEFEVPQCSGALRFMVVAKSGEKSFGAADKQMKVIDPITLYPAVPRVAAPGDELTLKVQVLSPVNKGKTLDVKVENKNLTALGDSPSSVKIDGNGEGMIAMKVKVDEIIGNAVVKVTVSGSGAEMTSETEMPIRMPNAEKRQVITKEIGAGQTVAIPFEVKGMRGTQSGNVTVSSLLPIDLFGRLDYLKSYPHGCLEQVTSKAMAQLYLPCFFQFTEAEADNLLQNVQSVIGDLRAYQKPDNSLTNWKGGNYTDPWTEIYALHFLVEAQKVGCNVPDYFIDGLKKRQSDIAKQWRNNPDFKQGETIQAYRLFVLALAGEAETGAMNRFKEMEMQYPLTKSLIAAAFAQIGKQTIAQGLLPSYDESVAMSDYKTSFGSRSRDLAFTIYTQMLCGCDATTVQNNVNALCGILNSDNWLDTQSTATALFVLCKYAEINHLTNANISAVVKLGGEDHTLNTNMSAVGFDFTPEIGANALEIKNYTDQKMVAKLFTKATVAEYETQESGAGIKMTVSYADKQGNALNPSNLSMGTDFAVTMTVENPSEYSVTELALSYYLPSGWEIVNERLTNGSIDMPNAKHVDIRDDRAYIYFDLSPRGKASFTLKLNATYEGQYMIPAVRCEDMYNNQIFYVVPARKTVVK